MTTQSWGSIEEFAIQSLGQTRRTANRRFAFLCGIESIAVAKSECPPVVDLGVGLSNGEAR